jgi:hypothetical protein
MHETPTEEDPTWRAVSERYTLSADQERRLARYRHRLVEVLPWGAPMRRSPERKDSKEMYAHVAFDGVYPPGFWKGWH